MALRWPVNNCATRYKKIDCQANHVHMGIVARVSGKSLPRPPLKPRSSFTVIRELNDGYFEVRGFQGRSHVLKLIQCVECEAWTSPKESGICRLCTIDEYARVRKASIEAGARKRQIANLGVAARKRVATMILAAPKWRDRQKIKEIYIEARRLSAETGIAHHVDHYYPLQGGLCSGLHVHQNLRVLPASENCSKSNGQPLENSPATVAFLKEYGVNGLRIWARWAKGEKVRL